jgi:hypothetical protein
MAMMKAYRETRNQTGKVGFGGSSGGLMLKDSFVMHSRLVRISSRFSEGLHSTLMDG